MCGFVGLINHSGAPVTEEIINAMSETIAHRGPDGMGTWCAGPVGLGHRRLAIIDLSEASHQPMISADRRYVLAYNGEIYNFKELRAELIRAGVTFRSHGDTEVVLAAYQHWGRACVQRFNGMFAFALWDSVERTLFLARDRYGIKPLYYVAESDYFACASEYKAFRALPQFKPRIALCSLAEYFTFQNTFGDRTLLQGVSLLEPGCTALVRDGKVKVERYWDYCFVEEASNKSDADYEDDFDTLFRQAVKRQMVSDAPVGGYLSGGLDSGAITALARQHVSRFTSFTAGFDMSSISGLEVAFDERARAEQLSYQLKTELYEVVLKSGDMERILPTLVWHLEDLRVGQCYPNYYAAGLASKFVKVVLAGSGGDELFGGYPWRYFRTLSPGGFQSHLHNYYDYWQRLVKEDELPSLFQPYVWQQIKEYSPFDSFRAVFPSNISTVQSPAEAINLALHFECKTFLHGLLVVEDKLSMAHGLENRVPFLDNDLVDFAMRLPVTQKIRLLDHSPRMDENDTRKGVQHYQQTNDGKQILRRVLNRYLPGGVATAVKQGFSGPDGSWFRGDSIDYVKQILFDQDALIFGYLRPDTVRRMVNQHLEGKENKRLFIWSLLCFEWWLRKMVR